MSLTLVTAPQDEPLTLPQVKAHLRVDGNDEDDYINTLITVVRMRCEGATRRTLITQTWDLFLDQWPTSDGETLLPAGGYMYLPKPPLKSVTYVKYVDLAGNTQTWPTTEYLIEAPVGDRCARGRLALGWVKVWPIIRPIMNAIQIRMITGYGDASDNVPDILRQAMLLDAGTLFRNRESVLSGAAAAAIDVPSTTRDIYRSFRSL